MKKKNKPLLVSVIIVNYNNKNYIHKCINSIKKQNYKSIEIIFVDDQSTDGSLSLVKPSKLIKIIKTSKKKTKFGSFNQINSYLEGFVKSKGELIFFLDSDDYFEKDKVRNVIQKFKNNSQIQVIFDLPIFLSKKKKEKKFFNQRGTIFSNWPRYTSQSCISLRRNYTKELFKHLSFKKFPNIWFDFRIAAYSFLKFKKIEIYSKHLTFYRINEKSASSKFKTFNKQWWIRRKEAHKFFDYLCEKNNKRKRYTLDKLVTNLINTLI